MLSRVAGMLGMEDEDVLISHESTNVRNLSKNCFNAESVTTHLEDRKTRMFAVLYALKLHRYPLKDEHGVIFIEIQELHHFQRRHRLNKLLHCSQVFLQILFALIEELRRLQNLLSR